MSHRSVDGTLVIARLARGVLGGAIYKDVTIRSSAGREEKLGTMLVLTKLRPMMVPGTRGRFYVHDVAGNKGLHGYRSAAGGAHLSFPRRWERLAGAMALLNLAAASLWLLIGGEVAVAASFFAVLCFALWLLFAETRRSSIAAFRADEKTGRSPSPVRASAACS